MNAQLREKIRKNVRALSDEGLLELLMDPELARGHAGLTSFQASARDYVRKHAPERYAEIFGKSKTPPSTMPAAAIAYVRDAHWALCAIPRGRKSPTLPGWQTSERVITDEDRAEQLHENVGLCHAYSGTCSVDVDDFPRAKPWLADRGIDLDALLAVPDAVKIVSGRAGRAKLLYRVPLVKPLGAPGYYAPPRTLKLADGALELRCATAKGTTTQCVLPPSIHPDTGQPYRWEIGPEADWRLPPMIPGPLLGLWLSILASKQERPNRDIKPTAALPELRELLKRRDPAATYNEGWFETLCAIHHETGGSDEGLELAAEWSEPGWDATKSQFASCYDEIQSKWQSLGNHPNPVTAASLRVQRVATADDFEAIAPAVDDEIEQHFKRAEVAFNGVDYELSYAHESQFVPATWGIKGVLQSMGLSALFSPPNEGKSTVATDLGCHVALGREWQGRRVKPGVVIYVANEDADGIRARVEAFMQQNQVTGLPFVIDHGVNLLERASALALARRIANLVKRKEQGVALIVFDTLAMSAPGANENTNEIAPALIHMRGLSTAFKCNVLYLHHSGKDASKGQRGWSGLLGAVDTELELEVCADARVIEITKQRNGRRGDRFGFKLLPATIGLDEDGDPVTACLVEYIDSLPPPNQPNRAKLTADQQLVLEAIRTATALHPGGWIARKDAVAAGAAALTPTGKDDRRRDAAARHINALLAKDRLERADDKIRAV